MPINDVNGNQLLQIDNFPHDSSVFNIEFGAGISYFGKREFPYCFSTDKNIPEREHFQVHPHDYETKECHFLDSVCDYFETDFESKKFNNIIFCNPYEIGFLGPFHAQEFINRALDLLNQNGTLHILGSHSSSWSKSRKIRKYLKDYIASGSITLKTEPLDKTHTYVKDYKYSQCDMVTVTTPNELTTIKKLLP